jgi:hypothetical protein
MTRSNYYSNHENLVYSPNDFENIGFSVKNKKQLINNSKVIKSYTDAITGDDDTAIKKTVIHNNNVVENPKQIGERKFVYLGGLKCKENTHNNVGEVERDRYIYFDFRPESGGLLNGLKKNIEKLDPSKNKEMILNNIKLTPSKTNTQNVYCRQVTCEVIDDNTNGLTELDTKYIAYQDMPYGKLPKYCEETDKSLYPPECDYTTIEDVVANNKDDRNAFNYYKIPSETFTNIKTDVDTSKLPKDKMIQGYYCLLSFLGLYLIYSCSALKPQRF